MKEGLGGKFWTIVHWTNWRVVFPMTGAHQERVASLMVEELRARRPVQLLVTNFPTWELNHTVLAYDYRVAAAGDVDFVVYDPNDPVRPRHHHVRSRGAALRRHAPVRHPGGRASGPTACTTGRSSEGAHARRLRRAPALVLAWLEPSRLLPPRRRGGGDAPAPAAARAPPGWPAVSPRAAHRGAAAGTVPISSASSRGASDADLDARHRRDLRQLRRLLQ